VGSTAKLFTSTATGSRITIERGPFTPLWPLFTESLPHPALVEKGAEWGK